MLSGDVVWVFNGASSQFPSGVFSSRELAESWIAYHQLSGVLTAYPLDEGVYEWAIKNNFFKATKEHHQEPQFIEKFSSASQEHYHYEDGKR